jgi:hypothetical protein
VSICFVPVYFAVVCFVPVCFEAACFGAVNFETACFEPACFEPACFELVELPVCSGPADLFEALFALPTRGARAAVAPEAACSRRNLLAVVDMAAPQVLRCSAPDEPVQSEEALPEEFPLEEVPDEAALFLLSEKVRSYGEVSDLLEAVQ